MDENGIDRTPDLIQVTLGSSQYVLVEGGSVDIEVLLANAGPSDFFIVNLLGIPPAWINYSGPSAVWVASGGQERMILNVRPPAEAEGIAGSYPARVYVFSQSAPDRGKEIPLLLTVVPEQKIEEPFTVRVETAQLAGAPGAVVKIPLLISNNSPRTEFVEVSVQGVPVTWVLLPSSVISLLAGEEKRVDLSLQIPATPDVRAGDYPLKISVVSQKDAAYRQDVDVELGIAAFESQGPVGVMLGSVQYAAAPGGSFTVPLIVLNRGLAPATFRLGVEGIPADWVSASTPVMLLQPGESREIAMLVSPPLSPASQAGRRKFRIVVMNEEAPEQVVRVDCILTLAAFTQFSAGLEPQVAEAGKPISVVVRNEGNTHQAFRLTWTSPGNQLAFQFLQPATAPQPPGTVPPLQPIDPTVIQIPPGDTGLFRFVARPRQRPLLGGTASYPYQVVVLADQQQSPALPGQVQITGLVPLWVLAIFLILCLWFALSAAFALFGTRFQSNSATQTAVALTEQIAGATQTVIANQTAAALAGQQDTDGDGLTNQREAEIQTNPTVADTDQDGLMDGEEVLQARTNPLVADSDGDGLKDGDEVRLRTDPLNVDSDGDGSSDGNEVTLNTNPLNPDTDNDGLPDGSEILPCPNPLNPDTDQDGLTDGRDINPCDPANPGLTATGIAAQPTATSTLPPPTVVIPTTMVPTISVPTVIVPTSTATVAAILPPLQQLPRFPGLILFESTRDGNPEIYTADASGQTRRMTNNAAADWQGVWDPGMRRIAFTSNRDGQNEIYLMNADGSNPVNLTNNPADDQNPAWSSDGQFVAFTSNRDGNYEIYLVAVNTLQTRNVSNSPGNDTQPSFAYNRSRDLSGDYLLFTSDRDGNREIYRMKIDGTGVFNMTGNPANDEIARASPDGNLVVFTTNRDGNQEIYSVRFDGQSPTNLTNNPANDYGPAWSPDQTWVAFTSDRLGNREVFILKPGLTDLANVTNNPAQDQASDWR